MWLMFSITNLDHRLRLHDGYNGPDNVVFNVSSSDRDNVRLTTGEKLSELEGDLLINRGDSDLPTEREKCNGGIRYSEPGESDYHGDWAAGYRITYTARPSLFDESLAFIRSGYSPEIYVVLAQSGIAIEAEGIKRHGSRYEWDTENHKVLDVYDLVLDFRFAPECK